MKLTKEEIKFIDNYLTNADVKHIDIRLEMIDHVATAIETEMQNGDKRGFYYIFKDYMVENKRKLLKENNKFINSTTQKVFLKFLKQLISPICILTFLSLFSVLKYLNGNYDLIQFRYWFGVSPLVVFILFGVFQIKQSGQYKIGRFSGIERLQLIFWIVYQFNFFAFSFSRIKTINEYENFFVFIISVSLTMTLAFALLSIKLMKYYRFKYSEIIK